MGKDEYLRMDRRRGRQLEHRMPTDPRPYFRYATLGVVKVWRYIFHMEDGRQVAVGEEYVGTEPEAMWEGSNRLFEHEKGGGETPVSIEVQSQGKPNTKGEARGARQEETHE